MIGLLWIAGFLLFITYLTFFWKMDWIRDLATEQMKSASKYRASKNRKIGKLPPVYPNGWFALLDSLALKKGQVKHVTALSQNFAVFRTESGVVRILDAYCPHLGANMAEGGEVKGEELECPFHFWRFCGQSGKCTSIPYSQKIPVNAKTKVWDCIETNGVIFVWYHAESIPPYWWPQPIQEISSGAWKYQGRNEFYINCHIQELPENGADWAHLNTLHKPCMVGQSFLSKIIHHSWDNVSWSPNYKEDISDEESDLVKNKRNEKHRATSLLRHKLVLFNKLCTLNLDVVANQIGPGYVILNMQTFLGPICLVQTVTPVEPLVQRVVHLMYAPAKIALYAKIVLVGEYLMFTRDAEVWNYKKYMNNPILISEERTINAFRRWYKQFYSENSPTYESCQNSLDW